jgi:hypothetical protein
MAETCCRVKNSINLFILYRNFVVCSYSKNMFFSYAENSNTVSQHSKNETKEDHHADSDEPCEMKEDSLEEPTEGTDEEDPLGESTGGANEEDTKVGKIVKLTVCSNCCIGTINR